MRYKVTSETGYTLYEQILRLLADRRAPISVKNDKRHVLALENPSDELLGELKAMGANVRPDQLYASESHAARAI